MENNKQCYFYYFFHFLHFFSVHDCSSNFYHHFFQLKIYMISSQVTQCDPLNIKAFILLINFIAKFSYLIYHQYDNRFFVCTFL